MTLHAFIHFAITIYSYVKVVTLLCLNGIRIFKTSVNNIININLTSNKSASYCHKQNVLLVFHDKIFQIISTRANKSEMNPTMAVALTGSNQSVQ